MPKGSCLCGAVQFDVQSKLPQPDACHCLQCRKTSGHVFVSCDVARSLVTLQGEDKITWFQSSEKVRRGFCRHCGSPLFWDPIHHDFIGIAMGAFDSPTETSIGLHVHVAEKADYYEITDSVPQHETVPQAPKQ